VFDEIVTDKIPINANQALFSIENAEASLCLLDSDTSVDKYLLDTSRIRACWQVEILGLAQQASERNYFGPKFPISPEIYIANVKEENRREFNYLIELLYEHTYRRVAALPLDFRRIFLRGIREKIETQEAEAARRSALAVQQSMRQLRNCTLAGDTENGKYSCEAMIPWYKAPLDERDVKNRFVKAFFSGLRVLVSPVKDGALNPVAMVIPERPVVYCGRYFNFDFEAGKNLMPVFHNYFSSRSAHVWPQSDFSLILIGEHDSGDPTEEKWSSVFPGWCDRIAAELFLEAGRPAAGLFFDQPMVCYVIDRMQVLADTCLCQKIADRIREPVGLLLRAFNIFAEGSNKCPAGKFSGIARMFCTLGYGGCSLPSGPAKDLCNGIMKIVAEKRFADVFGNLDVHAWMTFRECLNKMCSIDGKEPHNSWFPRGNLDFLGLIRVAVTHGINVNDHFYLASSSDPSDPRIYVHNEPFYLEDKRSTAVQAKCQQLMRLVLTPEVVVEELLQYPLCNELLGKFLQENRRLTKSQICERLQGSEEKCQVIIDMLLEYGYLVEKH
jgi:hypothetical protein